MLLTGNVNLGHCYSTSQSVSRTWHITHQPVNVGRSFEHAMPRSGWEPMVVNLGHCYRKQQRWQEAIQVYERALGLCPGQASTYAALGFTKHLKVGTPQLSSMACVTTCHKNAHHACVHVLCWCWLCVEGRYAHANPGCNETVFERLFESI